jgi:hypothetical protein
MTNKQKIMFWAIAGLFAAGFLVFAIYKIYSGIGQIAAPLGK